MIKKRINKRKQGKQPQQKQDLEDDDCEDMIGKETIIKQNIIKPQAIRQVIQYDDKVIEKKLQNILEVKVDDIIRQQAEITNNSVRAKQQDLDEVKQLIRDMLNYDQQQSKSQVDRWIKEKMDYWVLNGVNYQQIEVLKYLLQEGVYEYQSEERWNLSILNLIRMNGKDIDEVMQLISLKNQLIININDNLINIQLFQRIQQILKDIQQRSLKVHDQDRIKGFIIVLLQFNMTLISLDVLKYFIDRYSHDLIRYWFDNNSQQDRQIVSINQPQQIIIKKKSGYYKVDEVLVDGQLIKVEDENRYDEQVLQYLRWGFSIQYLQQLKPERLLEFLYLINIQQIQRSEYVASMKIQAMIFDESYWCNTIRNNIVKNKVLSSQIQTRNKEWIEYFNQAKIVYKKVCEFHDDIKNEVLEILLQFWSIQKSYLLVQIGRQINNCYNQFYDIMMKQDYLLEQQQDSELDNRGKIIIGFMRLEKMSKRDRQTADYIDMLVLLMLLTKYNNIQVQDLIQTHGNPTSIISMREIRKNIQSEQQQSQVLERPSGEIVKQFTQFIQKQMNVQIKVLIIGCLVQELKKQQIMSIVDIFQNQAVGFLINQIMKNIEQLQ